MKINVYQIDTAEHLTSLAQDIRDLGSMLESAGWAAVTHRDEWLENHLEVFGRVFKNYGVMLHNGLRAVEPTIEPTIKNSSMMVDEVPKDELWSGSDEPVEDLAARHQYPQKVVNNE